MPVIAFHLIFTGYGHWLPNDPRGSGSRDIRNELLELLGPVHHGRKTNQPPRHQLKSFYRDAVPPLRHVPLWFNTERRSTLADAVSKTITARRYTCWACTILSNHMHLCVRRHRNSDEVIWNQFAQATAQALKSDREIPPDHHIWADRPYAIFLENPSDIRRVIDYIVGNPVKEGLPPQRYDFSRPYDNWPFHKKLPTQRRENAIGR
jgi:REP element-mobilizing transposase RayT